MCLRVQVSVVLVMLPKSFGLMVYWRNISSFLNNGMNSCCRHLVKLCIGERSMGACTVSVIKLEIKFVKNSIKLMYLKILSCKEIRKKEQRNESTVKIHKHDFARVCSTSI